MSGSGEGTGPNSRVVEVMNFLAAHPTEAFTLAEIASRLGLSNGSAHRVLTTLAEARYLTRHPKHKTYSLGLAMVAIGEAALAQHRDLDAVRLHVARLAEDLKVQSLANAVVGNEMLIVACEGAPSSFMPANRVGERWPFLPPLGMGFVAWADEATRQEYLQRAPAALSDKTYERLAKGIDLFRERGFGVAGDGPVIRALKQFTSRPAVRAEEPYWAGLKQLVSDISEREIQLMDLEEAALGGISYITAPVFSPRGEVAYEISISGFAPGVAGDEVERYVARLREAAANATLLINGTAPRSAGPSPRLAPTAAGGDPSSVARTSTKTEQ